MVGIVRISRDHFRLLWAALTLIRSINGEACIVTVDHVSGTMKKVEQTIIEQDKQALRIVRET